MMHQRQLALCGLLSVALHISRARSHGYDPTFGIAVDSRDDNYTQALFNNANRHPNATRSVNFKPFEWQDKSSPIRDMEWTWRVNVTDFAAPNANYTYYPLTDPHVVNTAYNFTWPGGGNISDVLAASASESFCIVNLMMPQMPHNVTNTYTEEDTNSPDCTPSLGADCVAALLNTTSASPGADGCFIGSYFWVLVPECASTLGYAHGLTPNFNGGTSISNFNRSILSGEEFWGEMSGAQNGTNTTKYETAVNLLQVMMIVQKDGISPRSQLMFMRVNTTVFETSDGASLASFLGMQSGIVLAVSLGWLFILADLM